VPGANTTIRTNRTEAAIDRLARSNEVLSETADLVAGFLIAESEENIYQPVAPVATIREAREIAADDFRNRMSDLEAGHEPMCPARYVVWARRQLGEFAVVAEIEA
jgi:hypothetical protein